MRMNKKILTLMLMTLLIFTSFGSAFGYSEQIITSLSGINGVGEALETDCVRRDSFASIALAVAGIKDAKAQDTQYDDVKKDNKLSGYVQMVTNLNYMSGTGDGNFAPDSFITGRQAVSVLVKILGYGTLAEKNGGWPVGFDLVAQDLGLYKYFVADDEPVTYSELWSLIDGILEMPVPSSSYIDSGEISEVIYSSKDNPKLLHQKLNTYKYGAKVTEIHVDKHTAKVLITKAESNAPHSVGDTVTISAPLYLNILKFDKLGVNVWINEEDSLLAITPEKNYVSQFAVISSVNADTSKSSKYSVSSLKELMFLDDEEEYEVSDSLEVYLNGEKFSKSMALCGRYVRYVTYQDEIVSIETWDIKEGGLITAINDKEIKYQIYDTERKFADINTTKQKIVVLNGEYRDIKELRIDTLFDYYMNKDKGILILFASERKAEDTFHNISTGRIQVGNLYLNLSDNVYVSTDGYTYKSKNVNELLGKNVSAYIDVFKKVRYICPIQTNMETNEFLGYLMGVNSKDGLTPKKYLIANLDDKDFIENEYNVSDKITYAGLTLLEVDATAGATDGSGLYKFSINSKGVINRVEKMTSFYGFGNATVTLSSIPSYIRNGLVINSLVGQKLYFDRDVRVIAFDKEDKEFVSVSWNDIRASKCESIKFDFYGREKSSDVELIFVSGDLQSFRGNEETIKRGVITKTEDVLMDDGEIGLKIKINDDMEYILSKEEKNVSSLKKNTYIVYNTKYPFGKGGIYIDKAFNLVGNDIYSWSESGSADVTVETGTVEKIDGYRIYFTDGSCFYMDTNNIAFLCVKENGDIISGDGTGDFSGQEICYVMTGATTPAYEIETVFYTE